MKTYFNEDIYNILEIVGEQEKLNITVQCLENLISWCDLYYNNEIFTNNCRIIICKSKIFNCIN